MGTDDAMAIRFAVHAAWEVTASLSCIVQPTDHLLHSRLARRVPAVPDFDLPLLLEMMRFPAWMPDLLGPAPVGPAGDPIQQLEALADNNVEVAERDLETIGRLAPQSPLARMRPDEYRQRTAEAATGYFRAVIAPLWERVVSLAEADIAHHYATVAEQGMASALGQLHQQLAYEQSAVHIDLPNHHRDVEASGQGLWLVPSVFRWPWLAANLETTQPVISYGARGAGLVWEEVGKERMSLVGLIGRTRAMILDLVAVPDTTTRLARRMGMSAGTVSEHLSVMVDSGLLQSRRRGREVLYSRTPVADLLMEGNGALRRFGTAAQRRSVGRVPNGARGPS